MVNTSDHELAYRSKHYHDIRVVEEKQLMCASCGTQLNLKSKRIFSHPILGTLQCERCKICFENEDLVTDSDCINQYCYLCGRQCNSLYICSNAKCPYGFCKRCIKRNVRECLQDAESDNWECFVCNIKPFWELRAICAAVTTALVKKPRRKKFSQCNSNDRKDGSSESENSDNNVIFEKTRGSIYQEQLARAKKIVKAGTEDPSGSKFYSILAKNELDKQQKLDRKKHDVEKLDEKQKVDDNERKSLQMLDVTKNHKRNFIQDSDLTEKDKAVQDSRKITRFNKSETNTTHKSLRSTRFVSLDEDESYEKRNANSKREKKQRANVSETEIVERNYASARRLRSESKNSRYKNEDSDVEESEYHREDKIPKRLITSSKSGDMRAKRDPHSKQNEKKEIQCSNKYDKDQKSLLLHESESEEECSEEDESKRARKSEVLLRKRIKQDSRSYNCNSEEEEIKKDVKISKQMLRSCKNDTESSSGKEFQKSTLSEKRHRSMRKLYTINEDHIQGNKKKLITSQIELTDKKKLMTRKHRLTLKAYMKRLLNELKVLCSKLTSDTEKLSQKYHTKELIRVDDAIQMVLRSKDLVCGYKIKLDELEMEFVKSCNTWCKECDMKNIFTKSNCVSVYDSVYSPVKKKPYLKWKIKEEQEDEEDGDEDEVNVNINKQNVLARCSTPAENMITPSTDEFKSDSARCESRLSRRSDSIVQRESGDNSDSSQSLKNIETKASSTENRCERMSEGDRSASCGSEIFTIGSKCDKNRSSNTDNKNSNENVEVSECDSEEIFSGSEARTSRLKSITREKKEQMHSTTEQLRDKNEVTTDSTDDNDEGKILRKVKQWRKKTVRRLEDSDANSTNSDDKSVEPTTVDRLEGERDADSKENVEDNAINREENDNKEESMDSVRIEKNGKEETSLTSDVKLKLVNNDITMDDSNQKDTSLNDLFDSSVDKDKDKDEDSRSSTLIQTEDTQLKEGNSTVPMNAESIENTKTDKKGNCSKTENKLDTNQDNSDSSFNDSSSKSSNRDIERTRKNKASQFKDELFEKKRGDSKHDSISSNEEADTVSTQNLLKGTEISKEYVVVDRDINDIVTSTEEEALKLQDSENVEQCANELCLDTDSENSKESYKGKKCDNDETCSTKVVSVVSSQNSNDKSELKDRSSGMSSKLSFEENLKVLDSDVDSTCSTVVILDRQKEKHDNVEERKSGDAEEKNKCDSKKNSSDDDEKNSLEELSEKKKTTDAKRLAKRILDSSSNESDHEMVSVKQKHCRKNANLDEVSLNLRAKEALLDSSSSLSDVSDQSFKSVNSFKSSDSDLRFTRSLKRSCDIDSDISTSSKHKRKKFKPDKNLYNKVVDKKLKMVCKVIVRRLKQKDLDQHLLILKKSKQHQERKAFKSLLDLDNLEKRHRKNTSNSDDDSSKSLRESKKKKKSKAEKEKEETLMDHLEKVENGEIIERSDNNSDDSNIEMEKKLKPYSMTKDDIMSETNKIVKNRLLNSSSDLDGDEEDEEEVSSNDNDKVVNGKEGKSSDKKDSAKEEVIELDENCSENEKERQKRKDKSKWRHDKVLTAKLTESDSDLEEIKWNKSRKSNREKENEISNSSSNDNDIIVKKNERRTRRKVLQSDSDSIKLTDVNDDSDSSGFMFERKNSKYPKSKGSDDSDNWSKRTKRIARSSSTDSSSKKRVKPKRRRIKVVTNDSDSDSDVIVSSQGTPGNSSRKNIRKVLKDKQVADNTKQAAKEEEERLKRIAERQKLYNEMYEIRLAGEERVNKLVLDFDEETKEELISVHKNLVKRLKPHQAQGIKFMWDACFESVKRATTDKGSGCIIAHCMGLGKTLQVVTLIYTLLTHEETGINTILVVCPLSTILNWVHEFKMWLKDMDDEDEINIFELTKTKKNFERKYQLQEWKRCGGVMIIGYEMFRNLTTKSSRVRKGMQEAILKCLIDPGPDLVVCDEGHLLKNEDTALSKAMKRIKTLRRIVLTGTPLQNNLIEYHCMVQFVKPNLLGTKKEFMNRFVNPITNGQFDNSTELDVKLMKKRAHVLHKMLEGSIQRFDYAVLTPFLPPKQEYVIFVKLTECQTKLYQYYLEHLARRNRNQNGSLFADFQQLQRIWTHPFVLKLNAEKMDRINEKKRLDDSDTEGSLKDFIDDSSDDTSSRDSSSSNDNNGSGSKDNAQEPVNKTNPDDESELTKQDNVEEEKWWVQFIQQENIEDLRLSAKLVLLFGILKECEQIGDKTLVFSQSLYSLSLIEKFLEQIDNNTQNDSESELVDGHTGSWTLGLDYFRLDGQTSAENRSYGCKIFNNPSNTRARLFLISTKAGGLGINLTAANRVIIFDASWNPSHDVQSIFRVYRFGQKKPCYIYRFLASGTMEEKIYNRQVTKLSLSCRVVDEQQIERHYSNNDLTELYRFEPPENDATHTLSLPKDRLLAEIFLKYKNIVQSYHEHDSLLENKAEEELDEEERKQAWLEYEEEKKGRPQVYYPPMTINQQHNLFMQQCNMMLAQQQNAMAQNVSPMHMEYKNLQLLISKDYPNQTEEQLKILTTRAFMQMYNYAEKQGVMNQVPINAMMNMNAPYSMMNNPNTAGLISANTQRYIQQQPQLHQLLQHNASRGLVTNPAVLTNPVVNNMRVTDDEVMEISLTPAATSSKTIPRSSVSTSNNRGQEE